MFMVRKIHMTAGTITGHDAVPTDDRECLSRAQRVNGVFTRRAAKIDHARYEILIYI